MPPNQNLLGKRCSKKFGIEEQKHRSSKKENTFSVLQEEDKEPLLEEKEPLPINKIDKNKKKVNKEMRRERERKTQSERKEESEMELKSGLPGIN